MRMGKIASIEIRSKKFYIGAVMNFLDALVANHTTHDFGRYNRLRFVVGEILKRRIDKAYPGGDGPITVEFFLMESYFEVSIKDKGIPVWEDMSYDKNSIDISNKESIRNFLLDSMTDGFGMEKLGKDGQRIFVRMNILNKIAFRKPEPYPEAEVLDTNITIKSVKTYEDALEAIRCIYSEYGYSYSYEKLYYIDNFMNLIENGDLVSFLAVNDHGQTAGHFALAFSDMFQNMPEISTIVIRKEFRGLGLSAKFLEYSFEYAKKHNLRALMEQPVAFHPMTQKAVIRAGFTATAVLLSYIDSSIESEYNKDGRRLDLFACVKLIDQSSESIIYPPREIRSFAENVFHRLGCRCELKEDHSFSEQSVVSSETNSSLRSTKIVVKSAAADIENIINDTVKDSVKGHNEMIELFIAMNDPSCSAAYEAAKKCGFVFSGLVPGGETADYIIMQMIVGADCTYNQLVAVGCFEDLKNDIIKINSQEG